MTAGGLKNVNVTIRAATREDQDVIISLVTQVLSEFGHEPEFDGADADLLDIKTTYFGNGGFFNVALDGDDHLLGTFGVYPVGQSICKLRKMYLLPHARGSGLGKQMLEHAIAEARKRGFGTMILETMAVMKDAIRLYERQGFRLIKRQPASLRCELVFGLNLTGDQNTNLEL